MKKMREQLNLKKKVEEADDDILSELIANCESKMASKFKKEDPKAEESEKPDEVEVELSSDDEDDEIDQDKLEQLLEMYSKLKGK